MKRFKRIYIEISNVCNLSCTFCPVTQRTKRMMSVSEFETILNKVHSYGEQIYLHIKGEPLLHPDLSSILDICEHYQTQVNITTNGTLISHVGSMLLKKPAIRQINFSLHSFDGNDLNDLPLNKEEYIQEILTFIDEATQVSKMTISLRFWNNQKTTHDSRNRALLHRIEDHFNLDYFIEEKVDASRGIRLKERVFVNQDYEFAWPNLNAQADDGIGFCYGLRTQVGILADGTVVPCCLDGEGIINLGNIFESSFESIFNSSRAQAIYHGFSHHVAVEELCQKCGYRQRFGK